DGDGIHDLAVGVSTATGGVIALHRGNLDAFAPQSEASFWAIARSEFPSPYLREGQLVRIPSRPDFLAAGDFIGLNGPGRGPAWSRRRAADGLCTCCRAAIPASSKCCNP